MRLLWWSAICERAGPLMPVYPYRCEECGAELEAEQRITDEPLERHCDAGDSGCDGTLRRLIARTSFQLRGGGWAASGYR